MKSLREYLIAEKLKINKDVKAELVSVPIPKCENGYLGDIDVNNIWKTIKVPFKKYVIFIDNYRFKYAHFSVLSDFICQITGFQNDYEDYTPDKYILYASDDLDDIFNWYAKYLDIEGLDNKDEIRKKVKNKTIDNINFLLDMLSGNLEESDFFDNRGDTILSEEDLENWPEYCADHY